MRESGTPRENVGGVEADLNRVNWRHMGRFAEIEVFFRDLQKW